MLSRVGNLLPRSRDSFESMDYFFLRFTAITSTPTCVPLSSLCSNWNDHQALNIILILDNPKYVWRQTPLDLTRNSHTQHKQQHKNVARVFPVILKAKHKTLHVKRAWAKLEILQKSILHDLRSIKSNFRSIEPCRKTIVIFCNYSIPTLQTNTLGKSKTRLNVLIMVC